MSNWQIRSNSEFAENSCPPNFNNSRPIITKFGTCHDSTTVVTCTKFRYDRPTILESTAIWISSKIWIRSNLVNSIFSGTGARFRVTAISMVSCVLNTLPQMKWLQCCNRFYNISKHFNFHAVSSQRYTLPDLNLKRIILYFCLDIYNMWWL